MAQGVVSPSGGTNAWDLFVFGNGRVIYDVLIAIKLFMIPDVGYSGYRTLLLLIATIGFVLLAIQAGFDPGRNLLKMFTYIFVAWGVYFSSTQLTANITVNDRVTGYYNTVSGVPFVVGVPAALVSQIGDYFTRSMETYFNYPAELKMTGTSVGQFNLFGRMLSESQQYNITDASLRNSLRAYTADCVVPAIARGAFVGTRDNPDGTTSEVRGTDALLNSNNLIETLGSANHQSILTKYFPMTVVPGETAPTGGAYTGIDDAVAASGATSRQHLEAQGILVSCAVAYDAIKNDVERNANAMIAASSNAWSKTGVQVPLEAMHTAVIGAIGQGGANPYARFSSPNSFVQQQAMINLMGGAFRQAAAQTGNNEALTASLVSMAEQQQKSSWSTAFGVFNNMMGYVYTVLQAFIFAIAPLIIVAMLIPGMGGSIVTNYAQILVWLMLWQPMLAVINFLITLFGAEQINAAWSSGGGPTMSNRAIVSEKTNDLILAAQFLGTMTPLISWGIVKGALAFTEFIQKGVGSDVAAQAGAQAAAGSMSMSTIAMGNTSMNTFSTASSASVGFKSTTGYFGAGAIDVMQNAGGTTAQANSGNLNPTNKLSQALSEQQQMAQSASQALSLMHDKGVSREEAMRQSFGANDQAGRQYFNNLLDKSGFTAQNGQSGSTKEGGSAGSSAGSNVSNNSSNTDSINAGAKATASAKGGIEVFGNGVGLGVSGETGVSKVDADQTQRGTSADSKMSSDRSASVGRDGSLTNSSGHENSSGANTTSGSSFSRDSQASTGYSASEKEALSSALSTNRAWSNTISATMSAERSMTHNEATDLAYASSIISNIESQRELLLSKLESQQGSAFAAGIGTQVAPAGGLPGPGITAGGVSDMVSSTAGMVNSNIGSLGSASQVQVNPNAARGGAQEVISNAGSSVRQTAGAVQDATATEYQKNANEDKIGSTANVMDNLSRAKSMFTK